MRFLYVLVCLFISINKTFNNVHKKKKIYARTNTLYKIELHEIVQLFIEGKKVIVERVVLGNDLKNMSLTSCN